MKKVALALVAAVSGALAWRQAQRNRAEQRLWSEATDPVGPPR